MILYNKEYVLFKALKSLANEVQNKIHFGPDLLTFLKVLATLMVSHASHFLD